MTNGADSPFASPAVRRLFAARAARSLGQGALVAAFALYLAALGWSVAAIGATLSASLIVGSALTMVFGPLSDRHGYRRFLLVYEALQAVAAAVALVTAAPPALVAAAVVGAFGRGANGSAGPFAPLEQAWLAHVVPGPRRGVVLSVNAAIGFVGMGAGAALAACVKLLVRPLGPLLAYRPLFALPLAGSIAAFALIASLAEPARGRADERAPSARGAENRLLFRLVLVNALNGLGVGMVAPLIAYWLSLRFGRGPGSIGPALALSFVAGAFGSALAARLVRRLGLIRPVLWMRAAGIAALVAIPLVPSFGVVAVLYALRSGLNRGTAGARQALVLGLTRDRRGFAATVQNVSIQIPRAIGPLLGAMALRAGMLRFPFFAAAALQAMYLVLYAAFFERVSRVPAA